MLISSSGTHPEPVFPRTCLGFLPQLTKDIDSKLSFLCPLKFYYSANPWLQVQAGRNQHQVFCSSGLRAALRSTPSPSPSPVAMCCSKVRQEPLPTPQTLLPAWPSAFNLYPAQGLPVSVLVLIRDAVLPECSLCPQVAALTSVLWDNSIRRQARPLLIPAPSTFSCCTKGFPQLPCCAVTVTASFCPTPHPFTSVMGWGRGASTHGSDTTHGT